MNKASLQNGKTSLKEMGKAGENTRSVTEVPDCGCSLRTDQAHLRNMVRLCVLLLTARGDAADRIRGLQLGADHYLPKPFDPEELVARIRAIMRRGAPRSVLSSSNATDREMPLAGLTIDLASRTARYGASRLDLTDIELSLLETFLQSPGIVLTREELVRLLK